jgi:hypothetical protein
MRGAPLRRERLSPRVQMRTERFRAATEWLVVEFGHAVNFGQNMNL